MIKWLEKSRVHDEGINISSDDNIIRFNIIMKMDIDKSNNLRGEDTVENILMMNHNTGS